jgi:hypothetical protein
MADTALHLALQVIPEVSVRQWVCSLPWRLRALLGYGQAALRRRARGVHLAPSALRGPPWTPSSRTGLRPLRFVVELSRFYERRAKALLGLDSTGEALTGVATKTAERVQKILARHGRCLDGSGERDAAEPVGEQLALSALCAVAAAGHGLAGARAGEPLLRVVDPARARKNEGVGESGAIESAGQRARRGRRPGA